MKIKNGSLNPPRAPPGAKKLVSDANPKNNTFTLPSGIFAMETG